ncbi:MAG: glycosyltransferase family 39 protein [Bacteroidales bacterium]
MNIKPLQFSTIGFPILIALLLAIPAFMLNLGIMPYTSDEPTRGIVTLEMMYSGNYVTPTFTGEYYYNKPPGYNWILSLFFRAGNGASEWLIRLPAILALAGFAFSIFRFTGKYFGTRNGFLAMLMFLTCGRILFWDSMLGLIDILYSWITFAGFAVVINNIAAGNYKKLFLYSYLLTAAGFMLKGMPSLAFQGITLITVFLVMKKLRRLFSPWHFAGAGLFLLITGTYLLLYSQENSLQQYLAILWDQSSQRTAVRKGFQNTITHLVMFHPEMIYHFIPWSLLILLLVHRPVRKQLFGKEDLAHPTNHPAGFHPQFKLVLRLIFWVFTTNILLYWLSPATIPRYVLMLAPLTFIPLLICYGNPENQHLIIHKILKTTLFYVAPALFLLVFLFLPAIPHVKFMNHIVPLSISAALIMAFVLASAFRHRDQHFALLFIVLFTVRIVFNLTWLPIKSQQVGEYHQKNEALQINRITQGAPLQIIGTSWVDHSTILYLTSGRGETVTRAHDAFRAGHYYLADEKRLKRTYAKGQVPYTIHFNTFIRHDRGKVHLITFEKDFSIQ